MRTYLMVSELDCQCFWVSTDWFSSVNLILSLVQVFQKIVYLSQGLHAEKEQSTFCCFWHTYNKLQLKLKSCN